MCGTIETPMPAATMCAMVVSWLPASPISGGDDVTRAGDALVETGMHLMEQEKPLRFKIVKLYEILLCQRVCLGHEREQRFVA